MMEDIKKHLLARLFPGIEDRVVMKQLQAIKIENDGANNWPRALFLNGGHIDYDDWTKHACYQAARRAVENWALT